ncbi:MAG TPA: phosphatidate cytidylyltransferase [Prosthecochloris aestuarii]|uniref:Phosphatidate cytidylyltransferase n=1 Tax=Prosthecochloris aestuarii TaxID=1102 RepID=A0A831SRT2_PROAE|nr:phosphatidate cytidylyltransferase [Prosthecochloris aestuarii]
MSLKQPSNLVQRVLVALVGIPLLLWLTWQGGAAFVLLVCVLAIAATSEFHHLASGKAAVLPVVFLLGFTLLFQLNLFVSLVAPFILIFLLYIGLLVREVFQTRGSRILNIGASLTGVLYVNISFGSLLLLRMDEPAGMHLVFLLFCCVWAADIAAYFGGRGLGGRFVQQKFFERLSPYKTWEGYISGVLGSFAAALVFGLLDPVLDLVPVLVAGTGIGLFSPLGDLIESMFKRDAGVKDSSSLIPGHGGVLDRFDTVMFIAPLMYLLLLFVRSGN